MAVDMDVVYQGELRCAAKHGPSGNQFQTDAPVDNGGKGEAFSPTDLVGVALGACMVTIMGKVAQRHEWDLNGTTVHVVKEMVSEPMRRIGTLCATITLPAGAKFAEADRRRLERAADTCPVKKSLHPDVNVLIEYVYPE